MDNVTRFIDTLGLMTKEISDLQKHLAKLNLEVSKTSQSLIKGDVRDRETRLMKLSEAKAVTEEVQNFIAYACVSPLSKLFGTLETFHTILEEKEDEIWLVLESSTSLTAPQTVDHLTDAITDYLLAHNTGPNSAKAAFVDNPDSFVADFVKSYLDHPITDRMSDMVISLVTDWMSFHLN